MKKIAMMMAVVMGIFFNYNFAQAVYVGEIVRDLSSKNGRIYVAIRSGVLPFGGGIAEYNEELELVRQNEKYGSILSLGSGDSNFLPVSQEWNWLSCDGSVSIFNTETMQEESYFSCNFYPKIALIKNNLLFVSWGSDVEKKYWLRVADITDPTQPIWLGIYDSQFYEASLVGEPKEMFFWSEKNILLIACGQAGLQAIKIESNGFPVSLGYRYAWDTTNSVVDFIEDVIVKDGKIYILARCGSNPRFAGKIIETGITSEEDFSGSYLGTAMQKSQELSIEGEVNSFKQWGNFFYIASGGEGVYKIDATGKEFIIADKINIVATDIEILNEYIYIGGASELNKFPVGEEKNKPNPVPALPAINLLLLDE